MPPAPRRAHRAERLGRRRAPLPHPRAGHAARLCVVAARLVRAVARAAGGDEGERPRARAQKGEAVPHHVRGDARALVHLPSALRAPVGVRVPLARGAVAAGRADGVHEDGAHEWLQPYLYRNILF